MNCLDMVALTWMSKLANWLTPPKFQRLILPLIKKDSESEESDENEFMKDIANNFSAVEKTGPPIGNNLANIINNIIFNSVIREKLVEELERDSLKIKKCNPKT